MENYNKCAYAEFLELDGVAICNNHEECEYQGKGHLTTEGLETLCGIRGISFEERPALKIIKGGRED